jgi:hypothetical protein
MRDYFNEFDSLIKIDSDVLLAKEILSELCLDRIALGELIGEYFELMSKDNFHSSRGLSSNTLLLKGAFDRKEENIYFPAISIFSNETIDSIVTQSNYSILTPINTELLVDCYRLPENWNCEIFDPTAKIEFDSTIILSPGEVLAIKPAEIIHHFKFREPTVILKLQAQEIILPFEWSFDAKTKTAWQSISSHPKDSYAQHLCLAAKKLRDERLSEPLIQMLSHERHFIRWAAAQALGSMGRESGINALSQLASDRHPHVAGAAKNALVQVLNR